jgi:hypothetical protein
VVVVMIFVYKTDMKMLGFLSRVATAKLIAVIKSSVIGLHYLTLLPAKPVIKL